MEQCVHKPSNQTGKSMRANVALVPLVMMLVLEANLGLANDKSQTEHAMKVETVAEQLLFSTLRIETDTFDEKGNPAVGVGTGFIVRYSWNGKSGDFIVTNKHVLEKATKARFFFIQSDGKNPILGKTYNFEWPNLSGNWFGHPRNDIDVAILPLAPVINEIEKKKWAIFYRSISKDLLLEAKQEEEIDAIVDVVFIGYPSGIYDSVNFLPVVRKGTTATPLSVDYMGLPKFLIDAAVFPGSSGSPVFVLQSGSYSPRSGGLVVGNRFIFLGLISDVYTRDEEGKWSFTEIPTTLSPVVVTRQMMNLGVVVKGTTVFETIEAFLKSKGEIK
jgi:hypothetical protein